MTQFVTVWDDILKQHVDVPMPIAGNGSGDASPEVWEDVGFAGTNELRWGFLGGGPLYPNLGAGGEFIARACIEGKKVTLHLKGLIGEGALFPKPDAAWTFVLSGRLAPKDRAAGAAGIWHQGKGVISAAACRIRYQGTAIPPYFYLGVFWSPMSGNPGFMTGIYPANCWTTKGSYFTADITYEAA